MNIGATIKKLRRDKDMTQEQLADYLGISSQAVSRWETSLAMPDIALLPALANIFDVTTDRLLGVDISIKEKQIDAVIAEADRYGRMGCHDAAVTVLREGLKSYPNSYKLMDLLKHELFASPQEKELTKEQLGEIYNEVIYLGEKILAESTDSVLRGSALFTLCLTYPRVGREEDAVRLAETMPDPYMTRENLLAVIYKGDKRYAQYQLNIMITADRLSSLLNSINKPLDGGERPYTREEYILIRKKTAGLINLMVEDGNYVTFGQQLAWTYLDIAAEYAAMSDRENTLENLMLAKKHAITCDTAITPETKFTCLLLRGMAYGNDARHNITLNDSLHQLENMDYPAFDFVRDDAAFIEIQEELRKYAKKH